MKKILVLSDSHGNVNNMVTAVRNTHPDQIIHLGDCWVDAEKLHQQFPMIMMEQVPGNCDCSQEPVERYAFSSEWQVLLDSQDGLRVYHNRNDSDILSSFAARVLITLILELTWGIGLELNTHCTNTQIRLIGLICLGLWYAGPWLCRKLRKVQNAQ